MPTFKSYLTGFAICVALTLAAYFATVRHFPYAVFVILVLAVVQFFVQLVFFVNLHKGQDRVWNAAIFVSATGIVLVVVIGSIWIMGHLNNLMLPRSADERIMDMEGMRK